MVIDRRRALQAIGTTALATLAGCSSADLLGSNEANGEYTLRVEPISASPVEHALYEPDDGSLFGGPARTALDDILPDGRHTTDGYRPLPENAYVARDGRYYQVKFVVTGRERRDRTLVRLESLPDDAAVPSDAVSIDALERPSARVVKILHSNAVTDGEGGGADLLRGDAYVLRRPAERESRLASGDLDDRVVTMKEGGPWNYRVRTSQERILETAHTALAVPVADSREAFRSVVFGSRIDVDLSPQDLETDVRETLETAIARESHAETTPLSESFQTLLDRLGFDHRDSRVGRILLWYDDAFYRAEMYVNDAK